MSEIDCVLALSTLVQMNREKLMKMAGAVRTGGKGSMRRCKPLFQSPLVHSLIYWLGCGGGQWLFVL